jgi:hypothetical protein
VVDERLLQHWKREQKERERVRAGLPPSWRDDPRPEMDAVRETFVEAIVSMRRPSLKLVDDQ